MTGRNDGAAVVVVGVCVVVGLLLVIVPGVAAVISICDVVGFLLLTVPGVPIVVSICSIFVVSVVTVLDVAVVGSVLRVVKFAQSTLQLYKPGLSNFNKLVLHQKLL